MGRVIQLQNGETVSVIERNKYGTLSKLIYEYLGADCYELFQEYDSELADEIAELREDVDYWMERCDED